MERRYSSQLMLLESQSALRVLSRTACFGKTHDKRWDRTSRSCSLFLLRNDMSEWKEEGVSPSQVNNNNNETNKTSGLAIHSQSLVVFDGHLKTVRLERQIQCKRNFSCTEWSSILSLFLEHDDSSLNLLSSISSYENFVLSLSLGLKTEGTENESGYIEIYCRWKRTTRARGGPESPSLLQIKERESGVNYIRTFRQSFGEEGWHQVKMCSSGVKGAAGSQLMRMPFWCRIRTKW